MEPKFTKTRFEDSHIHSNFSDGKCSIKEILDYNNTHDKLDLAITDHVNKDTDWFNDYLDEIKRLSEEYSDFNVRCGCEVKILDETGTLNAHDSILDRSEIVIGSVHQFDGFKKMDPDVFLEQEYSLTKVLAQNKRIDILGHPFSMCRRIHKMEIPMEYIETIYGLCVENGIKFEYNSKHASPNIKKLILHEIENGNIHNFSFGSDAHEASEIGDCVFDLMDPIPILITGVGAGVGQSIIKAAKLSKVKTKIIGADNSPLAAGLYRVHNAYIVPKYDDPNYINKLIEICDEEKVKLILVGTDVELEVLSLNKSRIENATRANLVISDPETVRIADNKWETVNFLKKNGFPYAESCLKGGINDFLKKVKFPLIIKPQIGARSIGVNMVNNENELREKIEFIENPIIQECLSTSDQEYTCSSFFHEGQCYGVLVCQRWLRAGDTYKAIFIRNAQIEKFIEMVGNKLSINGPCNFQLRITDKGPVIFEINSRFSGTTGAASFLGFNVLNSLLQKILFDRPLKKLTYKGAYMFRYWNEVFVPIENFNDLSSSGRAVNIPSLINIF